MYTYLDILDKIGISRTLKKQSSKQSKKSEKLYFQIKNIDKSYLAIDIDTTTHKNKIPLWMFGIINK